MINQGARMRVPTAKENIMSKPRQIIDEILSSVERRHYGGEVKPFRFISAYVTTRHYGGPEEGGWWYNMSECVQSKPIPPCDQQDFETVLTSVIERWCEEYQSHGDIYSVLGGSKVSFSLEHHAGECEDLSRPSWS